MKQNLSKRPLFKKKQGSSMSLFVIFTTYINGYRIYADIMTEEFDLIYWTVCSSSRRGGAEVKGMDGGYRYLSQLRASLFRKYIKIGCNI